MTDPMKPHTKARAQRWKVAEALVGGMIVEEALLAAGYSPSFSANRQLWTIDADGRKVKLSPLKHPEVMEFMAEIRAEALRTAPERIAETTRKAAATVNEIAGRLDTVYGLAIDKGDLGTARLSAMDLAKLYGLIVDRKQIGIKPMDDMNEMELAALVGEEAESAGTVH